MYNKFNSMSVLRCRYTIIKMPGHYAILKIDDSKGRTNKEILVRGCLAKCRRILNTLRKSDETAHALSI